MEETQACLLFTLVTVALPAATNLNTETLSGLFALIVFHTQPAGLQLPSELYL